MHTYCSVKADGASRKYSLLGAGAPFHVVVIVSLFAAVGKKADKSNIEQITVLWGDGGLAVYIVSANFPQILFFGIDPLHFPTCRFSTPPPPPPSRAGRVLYRIRDQ
jgi:hypothetical protein